MRIAAWYPHPVRSRRASGSTRFSRTPPARWCWSAAAGGTSTRVPRLTAFAARHDLPVACGFRRQDLFDNRHPNYVGDVGIAVNPALATRIRDADVLLVIGERLGEMTTSGYTLLSAPLPTQALIHVHPASRSSAACTSLQSRSPPRRRRSRGNREAPLVGRTMARVDRRGARGLSKRGARRDRCPATWISGRSSAGWTSGFPTTRSSPTVPATTRRGCTASTAIADRDATRAVLRLDGLRRSRRGGREARASGAHRRLVERRRLFPDERAGARHGCAVRRQRRVRRDRQRHVRHDPHASGATLSRSRRRQRSLQPGLRRARASVRRAWRDGTRAPAEFAPAFERALDAGVRRCFTWCWIRRR